MSSTKDKENQITKNNQIFNNSIHKKRIRKQNIKKSKLETQSTMKKIKTKKNLILKKNKKIKNKIKDIFNERKKNKNTDSELNSLSYEEALIVDERTYCQYYCSLIKKKQSILFSFYPNKDYNAQVIKSFLFFFFFASDIAINALFFNDDTIHEIFIDSGAFNFIYQLPQIIYSYLISGVINFIIEYLSLSDETIISIKSEKNLSTDRKKKIICNIKIRFYFFFVITFILLLIFWYYISCFCCIYENTQMHLIKDSLLSLLISSIVPFFKSLIPGIFRIPALRSKKSNNLYMYKFSQFIENL